MKLKLSISLIISFIFLSITSYSQDALTKVLNEELSREMEVLSSEDEPPYYMSYRVDEITKYDIRSSFGQLLHSQQNTERILTVMVRVGSQQLDNSHELRGVWGWGSRAAKIKLPLSDDPLAFKQALWQATDKAYRGAVEKYAKVKANVAVKIETEDKSQDFSKAEANTYFEEAPTQELLNLDMALWENKIKSYSLPFLSHSEIFEGDAQFSYKVVRKYFVSSEGGNIAQNFSYARIWIKGKVKADDGMVLPLNKSYFSFTPQNIADDKTIIDDARTIASRLVAIREAPVVDPYSGPAILSGSAAGVFFHEIFGHRIEGQRQKSEYDGQTFKKKVGEKVLPEHISVVFEPGVSRYEEQDLNGYFKYDDQGIKGEKVTVVENGILKDFLMTRCPIENFPKTNGHARAEAGKQPESRQSNMFISSSNLLSETDLRKKLLEEVKSQNLEYGYLFESVVGGFTMTGRYVPNSFNVTPVEVYRVYADGRDDELVRGVDLVGTPLAMFSQVEEAGGEPGIFTGTCGAGSGGVPVASVSPMLFVKRIEMQKKNKSQERPMVLNRPDNIEENGITSRREIIKNAMQDELKRNLDKLYLDNVKRPFYISYTISDANLMHISSSLGSTIIAKENPKRAKNIRVLVGDYKMNDENFKDLNSWWGGSRGSALPLDDDYKGIRRALWAGTDKIYKSAAETYERKASAINQQNISEEIASLDDFSKSSPVKYNEESRAFVVKKKEWEGIANEISAVFKEFSDIYSSNVSIYFFTADVYFINNEGTETIYPFSMASVQVNAFSQATDGEPLFDHLLYYGLLPEDLPAKEVLKNEVKEMATMLCALRKAPIVEESYSGPVLFESQAAAELLAKRYLSSHTGLLANRKPVYSDPTAARYMKNKGKPLEDKMGRKVIANEFSISATPSINTFESTKLIGSFTIDAEGVKPAEKLVLVENGLLKTLLNGRTPSSKVSGSNGHMRLNIGGGSSLSPSIGGGVISFNHAKGTSFEKLKKLLLKAAVEEGLDYAYIIRKIQCNNSGVNALNRNESKSSSEDGAIKPLYVYKVSVKDGKEELVRSAELAAVSISALKRIKGATAKQQAYNTMINKNGGGYYYRSSSSSLIGIPTSVIVPEAFLLEEADINKEEREITIKLPVVGNPVE